MRVHSETPILQSLRNDRWLRPGLASARGAFAKSLGLGIAALVCAVGLMLVAGYLVACAAEQPSLGLFSLLIPVGFVQIFGIGRPFLDYLERLESHNWVLRISSNLRRRLFGVLRHTRLGGIPQVGEVLELLAGDVDHLQNLFLRSFFPLACAVVLWLLLALALVVVHPLCAFCFFVCGAVLCVALPFACARVSAKAQAAEKSCAQALSAAVFDGIEGISDWRNACRKGDYLAATLRSLDAAACASGKVEQTLRRFEFAEQGLFALTCVLMVVWAGLQFGAGANPAQAGFAGRPQDWACALSIGALALVEVVTPLVRAAAGANVYASSLARLNNLQSEEESLARQEPNDSAQFSALEADNLRFAYSPTVSVQDAASIEPSELSEPGEVFARTDATPEAVQACQAVLNGISLRVAPGEKVAILGPSGSGKSTLLSLLHGSLVPSSGTVCICCGEASLDPSQLGSDVCRYISLVRQQNHLFSQTLFENLSLGDASITRDQAAQALESVGLGPVFESLPEGLDTPIGEGGRSFSGGQEQRIALARVLLRQAPVVLLDEPTSGLDPATENALLTTIFDTLEGRSLVMVTHHLACVERFDRVLFLEDGRIAMEGTPAELATTNPRFQELLAVDRGM